MHSGSSASRKAMHTGITCFVDSLGSTDILKLSNKKHLLSHGNGGRRPVAPHYKRGYNTYYRYGDIRRRDVTACHEHPTSAYIHLPFCAQRCAYCAFTVLVSGRASLPKSANEAIGDVLPAHESYVDFLCREISSFFIIHERRHGNEQLSALKTVYLGGGTPSLLHPTLLERVLSTLQHHVRIASDVELTCEMDPATFNNASARAFAALGVNRASIGAQSFDDGLLAACGRVHRSADVYTAVDTVRTAGIRNVSIDLISGLPQMTLETWDRSLRETLSLSPSHISIYDLTLEPKTRFFAQKQKGDLSLPSEDVAVEMLTHAADKLKAHGYERYEVSNFAQTNTSMTTRSRHNLAYWNGRPFYAFGIGATSLVDETRFARPTQLSMYRNFVESLERIAWNDEIAQNGDVAHVIYPNATKRSKLERFEDFVINAMRILDQGVVFAQVVEKFGDVYLQRLKSALAGPCKHLIAEGLVQADTNAEGAVVQVRLTERGALIENTVVSDLLLETVWRNPPE